MIAAHQRVSIALGCKNAESRRPDWIDRMDNIGVKVPHLLPEFHRRHGEFDLRVHPKRQGRQLIHRKTGETLRRVAGSEDGNFMPHLRELLNRPNQAGNHAIDFGQENFRNYRNSHELYALSDRPASAPCSCGVDSCSGTPACCALVHKDCAGIFERSTRSAYLWATSSTSCSRPSDNVVG